MIARRLLGRCLALALCFMAAGPASAQSVDLTGLWDTDLGALYRIRQVGSNVYWLADKQPDYIHVFSGSISGDTVTGTWTDLPGGTVQQAEQTLSVRIETPDRLVKIGSSSAFGDSVWTRRGGSSGGGGSGGGGDSPGADPGLTPEQKWGAGATQHRGRNGERFVYDCPPMPALPGATVWGSGVYTDDSSVCVAAVHAGVINSSGGGMVTIEIAPGQDPYAGSTQNGVTTRDYGNWSGSFVIVGAGGGMPPTDGGGGGGGSGGGGALPPAADAVDVLAQSCEGGTGTQCTIACPGGMTLGSRLWGTGIYTDDSNVCLAAVHAGVISHAGGGWVTITIGPGQDNYTPSTQNGITSGGWGRWERSFTFAGASPGGGGGGGQNAGGPCADPRMQQVMDEWLGRAVPTAEGNLRYEQWGRAIGTTPSAVLTAPNPPDTHLSRCEYLLQQAPGLPSRNVGTLQQYLQKNGLI